VNEQLNYPSLPPPSVPTTVEKSVAKEGAFSTPGSIGKAKGWAPAKGVRFRPTHQKAKGRPRTKKHKVDPRRPIYY